MKNIAILFGIVITLSFIFVPNISSASGGVVAAASSAAQQVANDKAAKMMFQGGINSKVFQKADSFLKERFLHLKNYEWVARASGFHKIIKEGSRGVYMVLEWNGRYEVIKLGFFKNDILYDGNWTDWMK